MVIPRPLPHVIPVIWPTELWATVKLAFGSPLLIPACTEFASALIFGAFFALFINVFICCLNAEQLPPAAPHWFAALVVGVKLTVCPPVHVYPIDTFPLGRVCTLPFGEQEACASEGRVKIKQIKHTGAITLIASLLFLLLFDIRGVKGMVY